MANWQIAEQDVNLLICNFSTSIVFSARNFFPRLQICRPTANLQRQLSLAVARLYFMPESHVSIRATVFYVRGSS